MTGGPAGGALYPLRLQQRSAHRSFSAYNEAQRGRPVRPLARRALESVLPREGDALPIAIELGCGAGIEAQFLAENGFAVHAIDGDPSVGPHLAALAENHPVTPVIADLGSLEELPAAELVLSCATLSFVAPEPFARLWSMVREALVPGGVLAVDLFGDRDDWAGTEGTHPSRAEVDALLEGFEVLALDEEERDGRSFTGPKHWHTIQLIARRSA